MPEPWATFGVDLYLDLAGPRVRASLESALRDAIRTGRLRPGIRLPSSRALAADLGVARNTVADAYSQLVAEGWLASRPGAGSWVADRVTASEPAAEPVAVATARVRFDLRPGIPNLSGFPRSAWLAAARRALNSAAAEAFGYTDPRGLPQLREALADYLSRARGVVVSPDRTVICSGFSQGLELMCAVLRSRGAQTLATEAYTLPMQRHIATARGLGVTTLALDSGGAVIDELGEAGAVLLTPAHQFPIGMPLEASRRRQLVAWASRTGGLIIEDDYDGEFRYDRPSVGALQALAPEHVIYAGTASKSMAPGLRLGWLVLPCGLVDDVAAAKDAAGWLSSSLDQLTLAEFITSGAYDRHLRQSRLVNRRRRDRLVTALSAHAPQVHVTGIAAGLHALVDLAGESETEVVARAAEHGLAVEGLDSYRAGAQQHQPALVVGYATPPDHAFTTALARLCAVLAPRRSDSRR